MGVNSPQVLVRSQVAGPFPVNGSQRKRPLNTTRRTNAHTLSDHLRNGVVVLCILPTFVVKS